MKKSRKIISLLSLGGLIFLYQKPIEASSPQITNLLYTINGMVSDGHAGAFETTDISPTFSAVKMYKYTYNTGTAGCTSTNGFQNSPFNSTGFAFSPNRPFFINEQNLFLLIKNKINTNPNGGYSVGIQLRDSPSSPVHYSSSWSGSNCVTGPSASYLCLKVNCDGSSRCISTGAGNTAPLCIFTTGTA